MDELQVALTGAAELMSDDDALSPPPQPEIVAVARQTVPSTRKAKGLFILPFSSCLLKKIHAIAIGVSGPGARAVHPMNPGCRRGRKIDPCARLVFTIHLQSVGSARKGILQVRAAVTIP